MLAINSYVADRYEILEKIGSGGMSDVYRAMDHILGREVAVKVLKDEFAQDVNFVSKFHSEAKSAAGLEHPNIVNIYDVGNDGSTYYIVMEYVSGITLKTYIEKKGQLTYKEALSIAIQIGRGIEAAHSKNIIHRDIKPQNIIISTEGKVKVTDFGIARAASAETIHADVMGSVHYSSPEQARNGFVDVRSDIYSLGIVMFEMVTGRVPFDGENAVAIAIQHLQEDMPSPTEFAPELPISLDRIITKATQKSPDRRYANISEMLVDLKKSLQSPYEDFVVMNDGMLEKTRIVTSQEQAQIEQMTGYERSVPAQQMQQSVQSATALDNGYQQPRTPRNRENDYYENEYARPESKKSKPKSRNDFDWDEKPVKQPKPKKPSMDELYTPDYDDDDSSSTAEKVFTVMGIIAGLAIVGIVVFLLGSFFGLFNTDKGSKKTLEMVEMIDTYGMTEQEAITALTNLGFSRENILVTYQLITGNEGIPEGVCIAQSMDEGTEASTNSQIQLAVTSISHIDTNIGNSTTATDPNAGVVSDPNANQTTQQPSASQGGLTVPNVIAYAEDSAIKTLTDLGLKAVRKFEYNDNVQTGKVIKTSPASGAPVKTGDQVEVYISQGSEAVTMPNLAGKTKEEAEEEIKKLGLTLASTTEAPSDTYEAGKVMEQTPVQGKIIDAGTTVTLVISAGGQSGYTWTFTNVYSSPIVVTVTDNDGTTLSHTFTTNEKYTFSGITTRTASYTITNTDGVPITEGTLALDTTGTKLEQVYN